MLDLIVMTTKISQFETTENSNDARSVHLNAARCTTSSVYTLESISIFIGSTVVHAYPGGVADIPTINQPALE
jgi:hypothetical protein